jgi:hypothetical protein
LSQIHIFFLSEFVLLFLFLFNADFNSLNRTS